ncbi:hypothetical protein PIB30_056012 [Stylosanthes scabra]|uniref:C-JID domain-containing protein n=1 Tax=Stylosanthes scabra TaxID=79078 RepID=A0ABU6SJT7_9FABA|nr:hypothetical protein [Stylosanthes scabra]
MEDVFIRIRRAALTCPAAINENEDEDRRASSLVNPHYHYKVQGCMLENEIENEDAREEYEYQYQHRVQFCFPSKQVPGWFTHRTTETMMTVELVLSQSDRFLGFMLCVVVPKESSSSSGILGCEYCIEGGRDGKSVEYSRWWKPSPKKGVCENVFLWYVGECCLDIVREMKENVCNNNLKVSFQFSIISRGGKLCRDGIKQCGVHPIYASDMLKQGIVVTDMDDENENECDLEEEEEEVSFLHINKKLEV